MNATTLSHLLRALGGGESVTAFFLVLGARHAAVHPRAAVLVQA